MTTIDDTVSVSGCTLRLERPVDAEALVDEDAFADDEFLPYWAELWPSGRALASHVAELTLDDIGVLELGCGLGLPSLVAAVRGARVLATDWAAEALVLLEANARRNHLTVETALLDWRRPAPLTGRRFDLILAADVLYEQRNAMPILACLRVALTHDGVALVADPGRRHATGFPELAVNNGWSVELLHAPLLPAGTLWALRRS